MHLSPESRHQTPGEAANELRRVIEKLEGGSPGRDKLNQPGAPAEAAEAIEPTLMFVESRPKQQELLREFFTSRGFRVLLLGDLQRSLNRIESSPPDCVILMGASIGREILTGFTESIRRAQGRPVAQIAVLSKDQTAWQRRMELNATETARVLGPPLVIGDLHREIRAALAACGAAGQ